MKLKDIHRRIKGAPSSILLVLGFMSIILVGTLLLLLPISHTTHISFLDALFISTSAVCVTGLTPLDISSTLTTFGQTVLMLLFQLGGLGYALLLVILLTLTSNSLSFKNKLLVRESFGHDNKANINSIIKEVLLITFIVEAVGALLLYFPFSRDLGSLKGLFVSIFTSISAFNNAGFDLFGTSLIRYANRYDVLLPIAFLIITGGIGFIVIKDILIKQNKRRELSVHSKIVLLMTGILLIFGTLSFYFIQKLPLLDAFFQATTVRTAGFCSFDQAKLNDSAYIITIILMFIGASPCSTGGGIKTTTLFTAFGACIALMRGRSFVIFKRYITKEIILKALFIFLFAIIVAMLSILILSLSEPDLPLNALIFEVISALATVGLSQDITPSLNECSKAIIIILMYIGRVGIITLLGCFQAEEKHVNYLKGKIIVG